MKKLPLMILPILLITASAYAANSTARYDFTSTDTNVHETFHCTISNAKSYELVTGSNYAEMIKGFTPFPGKFYGTVHTINTYAFDAFHDPSPTYKDKLGYVTFEYRGLSNNITFFCEPTTGGRSLISGGYGMTK